MDDTNQAIEQECSELARAIAPAVLCDLKHGIAAEDTPHGKALTSAVYRAVDALEGQGAFSMRIARQLLEALARYELALGQLLIEDVADVQNAPTYRVQWCRWEDGGGADMQEWKDSDFNYFDEYEAKTHVEKLDERYKHSNFRHRYVEVKP